MILELALAASLQLDGFDAAEHARHLALDPAIVVVATAPKGDVDRPVPVDPPPPAPVTPPPVEPTAAADVPSEPVPDVAGSEEDGQHGLSDGGLEVGPANAGTLGTIVTDVSTLPLHQQHEIATADAVEGAIVEVTDGGALVWWDPTGTYPVGTGGGLPQPELPLLPNDGIPDVELNGMAVTP